MQRKTRTIVISADRTQLLLNQLCVLKAKEKQIRSELFAIAREVGPIEGSGLFVDERQTVYNEAPKADALAESLLKVTPRADLYGLLQRMFRMIPITTKFSMLKKLPEAQLWLDYMIDHCEGGGTEVVYGDAKMDVRMSAAQEGKHRVILPGEKAYEGGEE